MNGKTHDAPGSSPPMVVHPEVSPSLSWHCSPPWAASCTTVRTLSNELNRMKWRVVSYLEREAYEGPQVEEQEVQGCHADHLQSTGRVIKSETALTRAVLLLTGLLLSGRSWAGGPHGQAPPLCLPQPTSTADAAGAPRTP